jgi:hypothetical protein
MKLLIARPCGWGSMVPETCTWLSELYFKLSKEDIFIATMDLRVGRIALARNMAVNKAIEEEFDYLLMIDPDMEPDIYLNKYLFAKPFWESSMVCLKDNPGSIVGVPYMGNSPRRKCNVQTWTQDGDGKRRLTWAEVREKVVRPHFEWVPAIGTGLLLIDCKVFEKMDKPYFKDIYNKDGTNLDTGQDFYFTINANLKRCKVYCNWYSFAGHWHSECVKCPGINEYTERSEWDNSRIRLSNKILKELENLLTKYNPKSVLEIGQGVSTFTIEDYKPEVFDMLSEDSFYTQSFIEQFQPKTRGRKVQLMPVIKDVFEDFKPSVDTYDFIVVDAYPPVQFPTGMAHSLLKYCREDTVLLINNTQSNIAQELVFVLGDNKKTTNIRHKSVITTILEPCSIPV